MDEEVTTSRREQKSKRDAKKPRNPHAVDAKMRHAGPHKSNRRQSEEATIEEGLEDYLDGYKA